MSRKSRPKPSKTSQKQLQETSHSEEDEDEADGVVTPSLEGLKRLSHIQAKVEERLAELHTLPTKGKFRSQRGGGGGGGGRGAKDNYWCKKEVPWPQNYILTSTSKSRATYDSLTMSQWVSGFSTIIREESDLDTKKFMLEYLTDIMEDSQDFAVLLCKMEQDKIQWHETAKIDRVRRAHAQNIGPNSNYNHKKQSKPVPCKYYQKGTCGQTKDHENNGQLCLHACVNCFTLGKTHPHPSHDSSLKKTSRALHSSAKN